PANHVHRNNVDALLFVGRKLPKIGAEQIRQRTRSVDTFVPTGKRRARGAFDDGRPYYGNRQIFAAPRQNRFAEAFREGVSVRPTQTLRAFHSRSYEPVPFPAQAVASNNTLELTRFHLGL